MNSQFTTLGLVGGSQLIDKAFDHLPNRVFDPLGHHTSEWWPDDPHYNINHPDHRKNRNGRRRRHHHTPFHHESDNDNDNDNSDPDSPTYDPYPREDVRSRRFPPSSSSTARLPNNATFPPDAEYASPPPRRPTLVHRRSRSTQPAHRRSTGGTSSPPPAPRARAQSVSDRRDGPAWKRLLESPRKREIASGVVGAAAGGLLAHQAGRMAEGKKKGMGRKGDEVLLTVAGMVLGGLLGEEVEGRVGGKMVKEDGSVERRWEAREREKKKEREEEKEREREREREREMELYRERERELGGNRGRVRREVVEDVDEWGGWRRMERERRESESGNRVRFREERSGKGAAYDW